MAHLQHYRHKSLELGGRHKSAQGLRLDGTRAPNKWEVHTWKRRDAEGLQRRAKPEVKGQRGGGRQTSSKAWRARTLAAAFAPAEDEVDSRRMTNAKSHWPALQRALIMRYLRGKINCSSDRSCDRWTELDQVGSIRVDRTQLELLRPRPARAPRSTGVGDGCTESRYTRRR